MRLYSTNRINALGLKGPENLPKHFPEAELIKVDNDNIQESQEILYNKAKEIFNKNESQIFIGGDHSITYPIFKAFQEKNENAFLIIFDAHADCMPPQKEPTHEEFLRAIIENGFHAESILLISARKIEPEEQEFIEKNNIKIFNKKTNIQELTQNKTIYISIDIDTLDPKEAPAVNYPEENGLTKEEFFKILNQIKTPNTIDIVEAIPEKDIEHKTIDLIKKIISTRDTE